MFKAFLDIPLHKWSMYPCVKSRQALNDCLKTFEQDVKDTAGNLETSYVEAFHVHGNQFWLKKNAYLPKTWRMKQRISAMSWNKYAFWLDEVWREFCARFRRE